jgi:hypothetical protein
LKLTDQKVPSSCLKSEIADCRHGQNYGRTTSGYGSLVDWKIDLHWPLLCREHSFETFHSSLPYLAAQPYIDFNTRRLRRADVVIIAARSIDVGAP